MTKTIPSLTLHLATAAACGLTLLSPSATRDAAAQNYARPGVTFRYQAGPSYGYGGRGFGGNGYTGYGNGPYVYRSYSPYSSPYTTGYQYGYGNGYGRPYGGWSGQGNTGYFPNYNPNYGYGGGYQLYGGWQL